MNEYSKPAEEFESAQLVSLPEGRAFSLKPFMAFRGNPMSRFK